MGFSVSYGGLEGEDARRRWPRVRFNDDVELVGATVRGVTLDLGAGGLRVALDGPVSIGAHHTLRVGRAGNRVLESPAEVVWTRTAGENLVAGFRFL